MANGPAQKAGLVNRLLGASEVSGDPLEHSKLRREVSDSCQSVMGTCQSVMGTCQSVMGTCQSVMGTCQSVMGTCQSVILI